MDLFSSGREAVTRLTHMAHGSWELFPVLIIDSLRTGHSAIKLRPNRKNSLCVLEIAR